MHAIIAWGDTCMQALCWKSRSGEERWEQESQLVCVADVLEHRLVHEEMQAVEWMECTQGQRLGAVRDRGESKVLRERAQAKDW
jgi:hypothetical protein